MSWFRLAATEGRYCDHPDHSDPKTGKPFSLAIELHKNFCGFLFLNPIDPEDRFTGAQWRHRKTIQ